MLCSNKCYLPSCPPGGDREQLCGPLKHHRRRQCLHNTCCCLLSFIQSSLYEFCSSFTLFIKTYCSSNVNQMAFALPVWLAVQEELLGHVDPEPAAPSCFDDFNDESLFQMFHLTRPCITFITDAIRTRMKSINMKTPDPALSVEVMVMVALNYYAHGVPSTDITQRVQLNQNQTDCPAIISAVSGVIAGMSEQFISFPEIREARANVAFRIRKFCGIPNVLGVLAPAHFKIRASPYEKETFRSFVNTMGYTSVVSQLICDSDGNILSVERCYVGGTFEQEMWQSSSKGKEIEEDLHGPFWVIGKIKSMDNNGDLLFRCHDFIHTVQSDI